MKDYSFKLAKKRSRRYPAQIITNTDYAEEIALLTNTLAETRIHGLKRAADMGLHVNEDKTEYMCFNEIGDSFFLSFFINIFPFYSSYFCSFICFLFSYFVTSTFSLVIFSRRCFFSKRRSCRYGYLDARHRRWVNILRKKLDSNYARMLRAVLNKYWMQQPTKQQLYCYPPPITKTIPVRRTRHEGHCWRRKHDLINGILLWTPLHRQTKAGRPAGTYIHKFSADTRYSLEDLLRAMDNRDD